MADIIQRSTGAMHPILRFVDVNEQYGRHIVEVFSRRLRADTICDLGVGTGQDLLIIKKAHPAVKMYGIDFTDALREELSALGINLQVKDIEREKLDFIDESVDLFIANQVFEHLKEIFWTNDQIARKLKIGGHLIVGIPNISSLHNRILFFLGKQPTQMKTNSAHLRGFAHREIINFFNTCFPGGYKLIEMRGSQFYPFPRTVSRILCRIFPSLAFSNFYLFEKVKEYNGEFLEYPVKAGLETNFFVG